MNQDNREVKTVRYVSRGTLRIEAFVTHRDAALVTYHFGDPESFYEKTPEQFDAAYTLPTGKR